VKSPFHFSSARPLLGAAMLAMLTVLLAGCGQKGPLYIGKPPAERVRTAPADNMSKPAKPVEQDDAGVPAISLPAPASAPSSSSK
jgi:predicted small lipoprotein YifL